MSSVDTSPLCSIETPRWLVPGSPGACRQTTPIARIPTEVCAGRVVKVKRNSSVAHPAQPRPSDYRGVARRMLSGSKLVQALLWLPTQRLGATFCERRIHDDVSAAAGVRAALAGAVSPAAAGPPSVQHAPVGGWTSAAGARVGLELHAPTVEHVF